MISVKNLSNNISCPNIKPTIFPDKSSQVWKLPEEVLIRSSKFKITWHFESDAEVIQLLQLNDLLRSVGTVVDLCIPYLPYARQDKRISNETTFAQTTFLELLDHYFKCPISVFDAHNVSAVQSFNIKTLAPTKYVVKSLVDSKADLICYPDIGALIRSADLADFVVAEKIRDQATGKILEHKLLENKHSLEGRTVLIVDDICDFGSTFISVAKMLKAAGAGNIDLYVSHGIFSGGVHILKHAGIRNIYTTDSFIGSSDMSKSLCTEIYKLED